MSDIDTMKETVRNLRRLLAESQDELSREREKVAALEKESEERLDRGIALEQAATIRAEAAESRVKELEKERDAWELGFKMKHEGEASAWKRRAESAERTVKAMGEALESAKMSIQLATVKLDFHQNMTDEQKIGEAAKILFSALHTLASLAPSQSAEKP